VRLDQQAVSTLAERLSVHRGEGGIDGLTETGLSHGRGVPGPAVKTTGDGILATFDGPGRAIRCAAALRDELRGIGLQIRAGLHTGEVELRDGDVGGIGVHIAARIVAAAQTGEILTSRTVRDLVVGSDIAAEDRGTHALKGIDGTWQLFTITRP
jgi:class 3 adenylate cyclase